MPTGMTVKRRSILLSSEMISNIEIGQRSRVHPNLLMGRNAAAHARAG